jgi:hypothetical protein
MDSDRLRRWLVLLTLNLPAGVAIGQESTNAFDWGASERIRFESKQDFNFDDSSQDYLLARTRLHLSYTNSAGSTGFLELQDARVFGENDGGFPGVNGDATPNVFEDHLDVHQAYWNWKLGDADLRVGRQKFNLGDQRLVASLEWVNTARVYDAVRLTLGNVETRQVDVFLSELVAVDPDGFNDHSTSGNRYLDSSFHGAYASDRATLSTGQLEYWYFYRDNDQFRDKVSTFGLRYTNADLRWQPDLQAAYQLGKFNGEDHSAWMLHAGVKHERDTNSFSLAYSYGSGDSDPDDGDHDTFDNLYPLNHAYYGYMDFFSLQNAHNLALSYTKQLGGGVELYGSWNAFWLDKEGTDSWYHAGRGPLRTATGNVDSYVGSELDITLKAPVFSGRVNLFAGLGQFFPGSYLDAFDLDASNLDKRARFFFVSATYKID